MFTLKFEWLLAVVALLAALVLGPAGCAAPQTTQELELLSGKLQAQVQAMRAAGIEGFAVAHVETDEIGSLCTTLRGPVRADVYVFAKAEPPPATGDETKAP